ncbi:DUF1810 domain-containing protein [Paracoccus suum]|uniref:DUF1810 domain-containing protein n=1 Tax=Paracoccus suum TaxID=2259340 RepID=A0A344PIC2_9RHOB|nr:DUF1810 domain-containing protein [Paracoccus suum]AXC49127.1 DUF1810 domain-containing protein [Paracoccus suum]
MSRLNRFHEAQSDVHGRALAELRAGRKTSHWMWFIFPQLAALGRSSTAKHYGIAGLAEARDYLADPVLGERLRQAATAMLANRGTPPEAVLGQVDALKLRSSATLFAAAGGGEVFQELLDEFYGGQPCPLTQQALVTDD